MLQLSTMCYLIVTIWLTY